MSSVLLVGNYRPSIAVVRSLARAGYRPIVGIGTDVSFAERSRFCSETWHHPSFNDGEAFMRALVHFLAGRPDIALVMPIHQSCVALLARESARLPHTVTPVIAAPQVVETCLNKMRMYRLAASLNVPIEPYALAGSLERLEEIVADLGWPVIIRPLGSGAERLSGGRKALICTASQQLRDAFDPWPDKHPELLVQRFAPGPRHNVYFAAWEGRIIGRVEVLILRTDQLDDTGFAVEGVSVAPDPALDRYTTAVVGALGYTGVGCLQFVRRGAGQFHFLELNPRLGANFVIADECGLDLARAACEIASGRVDAQTPAQMEYPVGVRYAWTFGDLRAMRKARAHGQISRSEAFRWTARAVRAGLTADVHLTWSLRDPKPACYQYLHWAPFGIGRLFGLRDFESAS